MIIAIASPFVPAQAGTQGAQVSLAQTKPLSSRVRGDDSGESLLHIFESGDPGATRMIRTNGPWIPACAGTDGIKTASKVKGQSLAGSHGAS